MRVHYFQHVAFEGPAGIAPWMEAHGHEISTTRWFAGETPPPLASVDWLVVLGGPMSVNDDAILPWLRAEKAFVADAISTGLRVLGICLGAQMIASVAGARVYRNRWREIGWHDVRGTAAAAASTWASVFPAAFPALHWHGETFDLPPGAIHLARTSGCENQAFALGPRVLGLQFHLEATPAAATALCDHAADDMVPGPYVQTRGRILEDAPLFTAANRHMADVLTLIEAAGPGA